jgi:hypothetical protein
VRKIEILMGGTRLRKTPEGTGENGFDSPDIL